MRKLVWDTSAIMTIKEPDQQGYSPAYSLFKDLSDGWIPGPYLKSLDLILDIRLHGRPCAEDGERVRLQAPSDR